MIAISVTDTGVGIAASELDRIFDPFGRGDASVSRSHEGTGLGLTITKRLVDLSGGRLSLQSQVGIGTTVRVWLPAVQSGSFANRLEVASSH